MIRENQPQDTDPGPSSDQSVLNRPTKTTAATYEKGHFQNKYRENEARFPTNKIRIHGRMIEQSAPVPHDRLDGYEVIRHLGKGGYGQVYAVQTELKPDDDRHILGGRSQLALKTLKKYTYRSGDKTQTTEKEDWQDVVNIERSTLASMPWHPFVAGLYDCQSDARNLYMLTELAPCGTLADRIMAQGPLRSSVCQWYFANLVLALEHVHSLQLVHCDIKPDNVLVGASGYLMLTDFGLSRRVDLDLSYESWTNLMGNPGYAPPEYMKKSDPKNRRRDIDWWGAAIILVEMGTGYVFCKSTSEQPRWKDITTRTPDIIRNLCLRWDILETKPADAEDTIEDMKRKYGPLTPVWLLDKLIVDLAARMLQKDPSKRYGMTTVRMGPALASGSREQDNVHPDWMNTEIREHPFMAGFRWDAMLDRALLAPWLPEVYPDLAIEQHDNPLPEQYKVPGLRIARPPLNEPWSDSELRALGIDGANTSDARAARIQALKAREAERARTSEASTQERDHMLNEFRRKEVSRHGRE